MQKISYAITTDESYEQKISNFQFDAQISASLYGGIFKISGYAGVNNSEEREYNKESFTLRIEMLKEVSSLKVNDINLMKQVMTERPNHVNNLLKDGFTDFVSKIGKGHYLEVTFTRSKSKKDWKNEVKGGVDLSGSFAGGAFEISGKADIKVDNIEKDNDKKIKYVMKSSIADNK